MFAWMSVVKHYKIISSLTTQENLSPDKILTEKKFKQKNELAFVSSVDFTIKSANL